MIIKVWKENSLTSSQPSTPVSRVFVNDDEGDDDACIDDDDDDEDDAGDVDHVDEDDAQTNKQAAIKLTWNESNKKNKLIKY